MYPATLTLALGDEALRAEAIGVIESAAREREALENGSERLTWTQVDPHNWTALLENVASHKPEALLLDITCLDGDLPAALRQVRAASPQTRIVAMHPLADSQSILTAMRAGATEFVHPPFDETLLPALRRISAASDADVPRRSGKLIAFLSAKGGCGATTLACHVAPELQRQTGGDVLLVDFDFTSGVLGFLMKTNCSYSVLDAVKNLGRLDTSLWKALIGRTRDGLSVLPAPASIAHGEYPNEGEFKQILRFMRTQHDWTVIDLGRSLTRTARAVLDEVDDLFLVSTLEVMALHGLKTIVRAVSQEPANNHKLNLILNRTPKMMDITLEELQKILGRPLYATLPNDYPSLHHSYANGTLLPANSKLAEQFSKLARKISGKEEPKGAKKRFALFG